MKTTPVKGTNDFLPEQANLRDFLQQKILQTYKENGFERIYTPILEDIENLQKSEGGENLNLIFKVLKRGEKLEESLVNHKFENLADLGLRYDLTLPLSRFYANNFTTLQNPFKCIQIDKVYRAERPQKGREREFVQCDIDILGSESKTCEVELIATTCEALLNIGIGKFKVRINDRRILKSLLLSFGFFETEVESVSVIFDKLDKIGVEGVCDELLSKGFNKKVVKNFEKFLKTLPINLEKIKKICGDTAEIKELEFIIDCVKKLSNNLYDIRFDISLVRGQGYYTGAVFEIESEDFNGSIGGGGRYDNLIGKFVSQNVPAVGFSIGFERIFSILSQQNFKTPESKKVALFYNQSNFVDVMKYKEKLKKDFYVFTFEMPNKLGKFLSKLQDFYGYCIYENGEDLKPLKENQNLY